MDVSTYLESERARPFVWGETDCASTADRWFKTVHGYSPMVRYGRTVMNESLGRAWLGSPGGIIRGVRNVMDSADAKQLIRSPEAGDIGIVVVENRACIAIFDGDVWCSRDEDGFIVADDCHRHLAWEVAICRSH